MKSMGVPGDVILLEGGRNSRRGGGMSATSSGFLLAVYYSPGSGSSLFQLTGSGHHGANNGPCAFHGVIESDVISFSGNIGLEEICWLEHAWSLAVESAKATGWVLLLGFGSLLCYRLYANHRETIAQGIRSLLLPQLSKKVARSDDEYVLGDEDLYGHEEEEPLAVDITLGLNCLSCARHPSAKTKVRKGAYMANQIKTRWRHVSPTSSRQAASPASSTSPSPLPSAPPKYPHKSAMRRNFSNPEAIALQARRRAIARRADEMSGDYYPADTESFESSPDHTYRIRTYSLYQVRDNRPPPEDNSWPRELLGWEGSVDSFTSLGADVSEVSRMIRECSVDSDGSDFSLNMSIHESYGLTTLQVMERIEAEVNSVKNNCMALNQEIYTLHDPCGVSNLPHSESDLSINNSGGAHHGSGADLVNLHVNRASFKGLLSLTTIPAEFETSDSPSDSPLHRPLTRSFSLRSNSVSSVVALSEDEHSSLEWDNEGLPSQSGTIDDISLCLEIVDEEVSVPPEAANPAGSNRNSSISPCPSTTPTVRSERDRSASPVTVSAASSFLEVGGVRPPPPPALWCSQESGYLEWDSVGGGTTAPSSSNNSAVHTPADSSSSVLTLSPLVEKREKENDSMSCTASFYSLPTSSPCNDDDDDDDDDYVDEDHDMDLSCSKEESVLKRRQWVETSKSNRDSAVYDIGVDVDASWTEEAVGPRIDLHSFAESKWQAPTPRACAIKQAFAEVERMTGCRWMRRMRGDQYGVLRAALFQMVDKKLRVPRSEEAMYCIRRDIQRGCQWISDWSFGHRLPYGAHNVMHGISDCLTALDRLMDQLSAEADPADSLVCRLNADILLDTRVMEALKLHILSAALSLELGDSLGDALPLFALALFTRNDSKSAQDLAINYLNPIGDSAVLERAEFYLLSYALGVRLEIFRPTGITLDKDDNQIDLRTCYPDWESFNHYITVIEEDNRHYSVPVP